MARLLMIAKNNMKRQRGDMITFFILTLIATFLFSDCLSAILGMQKVLDDRYRDINGAEIFLYHRDTPEENAAADKAFADNPNIGNVEKTPLLMQYLKYRKAGEADFEEYAFFVNRFDDKPAIHHVLSEEEVYEKNDIVLPLYLKGDYPEGSTMEIVLGDHTYNFKVAGYAEDPYLCSTMNFTVHSVYISEDAFRRMCEDEPEIVVKSVLHKGKYSEAARKERVDTRDLEKEIGDAYKKNLLPAMEENPDRDYNDYIAVNWDLMRGGSIFLPGIVMSVIMLFALIILVVAVTIITFSVRNFITRNMKNTGILEASGYTVRELRLALVTELVLVALCGSLLGVLAAILTFKPFGNLVTQVLGLTWNQPMHPLAVLGSVFGLLLIVALVGILASRAYRKITVLDALRGGITVHNFKKNLFSMEKTKLPLPVVMSLKETFGGMGRNIVLALIIMVISTATLLGGGMLKTYGGNPDQMLKIMGFETGIAATEGDETMGDGIRKLPGVKKVLAQFEFEPVLIANGKDQQVYTFAVDDFDNTSNTVMIEGRMPEHDNEILVTESVADDMGLSVGDAITVSFAGKTADYLIVGFNQRMERMGRTAYMTLDGLRKLVPGNLHLKYRIVGEEGVTYKTIEKELMSYGEENGKTLEVVDVKKNVEGTMETLTTSMSALCALIAVVTAFIVIFVESLVIRAKVTKEWKNMGISKGLGMTSRDLIVQIMLSNLPAILTGCVVAVISASWIGKKICILVFSMFGLKQMPFDISIFWKLAVVLGVVLVALVTAALSGLKVRKLVPVEMITEE